MRFLFRIPKHQQFQIKPRYYDPVKEEIEERVARIKQREEGQANGSFLPPKIEFKRKTRSASSTSLLQLGIATILGVGILGWLYMGDEVIYYLGGVGIPVYLLYRFKSLKKSR